MAQQGPHQLTDWMPALCSRAPQPQQQKKKDKLMTMDPKEITYEMVNRKLREIVMSRGRRGTDKQEQVGMGGCMRARLG